MNGQNRMLADFTYRTEVKRSLSLLAVIPVFLLVMPVSVFGQIISYQFDKERSDVRLLVYKSGPLQFLGHNHVIRINDIDLGIDRNIENIEKSTLKASIRPEYFIMDLLKDRKKAGKEFSSEIDHESSVNTRKNMLGRAVLDTAKYPLIYVNAKIISKSEKLYARLELVIRKHAVSYTIPIDLYIVEGELNVRGKLNIKQTDFGIEPFSLFGGLLSVRNEVELWFDIVAKEKIKRDLLSR